MSWLEALLVAIGAIYSHKLRSCLTLIGVIIGVMCVVTVASIIEGANNYVATKIATLGSDVVQLDKFGLITSIDVFIRAQKRNKDLTADDAEALRQSLSSAEQIGIQASRTVDVRTGGEQLEDVVLRGVSANMALIDQTVQVDSGRYIAQSDIEHHSLTAVIGTDLRDRFFPGIDPLGKELKINGLPFTVVGVAKPIGSVLGQSQDGYAVIPITAFQKMYGSRQTVAIKVKTFDGNKLSELEDQVRMVMRARHHLKYNESDDFGFITAKALNDLWKRLTGLIAVVAMAVVSISLVVGGIVIMNIMMVTVTERTKEIGIRKSLGARRRDILWQFLIESSMLSSFGGVLGLLLAWVTMFIIQLFIPIPFLLPVWAIIAAITVSTLTGLIFGVYPAWRASKLDPIEALRHE